MSLVRYAGGIIEWTKQELRDLDRRTRKLLTMNGGFHSRDCLTRLYVPRKDGGRGLLSVEDYVNQARISLEKYVQSGKTLKVKKRLPALKQGRELKIFKNRKKSRYMGNLRDRVKIKEVKKCG